MKKVDIKCDILGALATLNIELHYTNSSEDNPVEATYEFPLDKSALVSKLMATIGGKTIEAKVREKEEAKERYDDAIAAGNAAVLAERQSDKKESMTIKLGNLQPQQDAIINLQVITQLKVLNGSYQFELPMAFYPDYSKHGARKGDYPIDFNYQVHLQTKSPISSLSLP